MKGRDRKIWISAGLGGWLAFLLPALTDAASLETLRACGEANAPKASSSVSMELISTDRSARETVHEGKAFWRSADGDRYTVVCLDAPRSVEGLAYMIREGKSGPALWGFLPEEDRVMALNVMGAARRARIGRTAVSGDDLRYFPINHAGIEADEVEEQTLKGRAISIVRLTPPMGDDSPYARVISYIDDETCVPILTEFYDSDGTKLKVVTAKPSRIKTVDGLQVAHALEFRDLKDEIVTELNVKQIAVDPKLPDTTFEPSHLGQNACKTDVEPAPAD